jgi:hypothetical protein
MGNGFPVPDKEDFRFERHLPMAAGGLAPVRADPLTPPHDLLEGRFLIHRVLGEDRGGGVRILLLPGSSVSGQPALDVRAIQDVFCP